MRILIPACFMLAALAAAVPATAQSLIVIALCSSGGSTGPTLERLQTSQATRNSCTDLTPDNAAFCQAVAEVAAAADSGLPCAEAVRHLYVLGFEKTFLDAVVPGALAARPTLDRDVHSSGATSNYVLQRNQTDLQFLMERAGRVDLIGCRIRGGDGPAATYFRRSDGTDVDPAGLSCADALQASVDDGNVLSARLSTVVAGATRAGLLQQQGRLALDSDANEAKPAEFVIVRIGEWTGVPEQ